MLGGDLGIGRETGLPQAKHPPYCQPGDASTLCVYEGKERGGEEAPNPRGFLEPVGILIAQRPSQLVGLR